MEEIDLIAPKRAPAYTFSLEPAHNVVCSLLMLNMARDTSGFSEWVYQTADALPPDRLHTNWLVLDGLMAVELLANKAWPSFPAWVDHLASLDSETISHFEVAGLLRDARERLGDDVPSLAQLKSDREAYLSLIERIYAHKGKTCDRSRWEEVRAWIEDPPAMQDLIVTHLRTMWNEFVGPEWKRNLPLLEESTAAFQTLHFIGMSTPEVFRRVTERDVPAKWEEWQEEVHQFIFIPSAHIGPYLLLMGRSDTTARIAFGARVPEGATIRSRALNRSDLLMRLSALADDTRLCILELLAEKDELSAQDIMDELGLSQSAASRHLRQLSATGYLTVQRSEGVKRYSLNRSRIDDTLHSLKQFL